MIQIIYKKTDELIPYARNQRVHSSDQIQKLAGSIKEFGFKNPVIIAKDNEIIAGHGRIMAAQLLGIDDVPCIVADDLNEAQIKAFRIADNKLNDLSFFDDDLLALELKELHDEFNYDIELVGYSLDDMEDLLTGWESDHEDIKEPKDKEESNFEEITVTCNVDQKSEILAIINESLKNYNVEIK